MSYGLSSHPPLMAMYSFWQPQIISQSGLRPFKRELGAKQIVDFIRTHLIYKYGVPYKIIADKALYFKNQNDDKLTKKYKFRPNF